MIITTEIYPSGVAATRIEPDEGFKYISNGEVWSELVFLGRTDSIGNWHDTNDGPPVPENDELTAEEALDIITGGAK